MPSEPEQNPETPRPKRRRPRGKPVNDGFVVFEVDGFAQLTPEQRTWPVFDFRQGRRPTDSPPADAPEKPPEG
jgi:hypothetical protein